MMIGKQANKKRLQTAISYPRFSEGGFTIIESLVAILVVSILLVAIAPVLSLSVATRIQSRRVELATQAARSYIDGVKTKKITAPAPPASNTALTDFITPTPSGSFNCTANSYCTTTTTSATATNLYCIDFDGDNQCKDSSVTDMVVQAFRPNNNNSAAGYALGVRVYRADAFKDSTALIKSTSLPSNRQATFTGGVGQRKAPLVEMTTDINDTVPKYSDLCARSGGCSN